VEAAGKQRHWHRGSAERAVTGQRREWASEKMERAEREEKREEGKRKGGRGLKSHLHLSVNRRIQVGHVEYIR
jgi:hypothetical protein